MGKRKKPTWTDIAVRLGDLQPWEDNPRQSTKKQARKLLESWEQFGQIQAIAVDPKLQVLDGHQRLSALLTLHGEDYEIDARQSSRAFTKKERRQLVLTLHAAAVGGWDWDALSGWDENELQQSGFDTDLLDTWNMDALNLREFLESSFDYEPETDPQIGNGKYTQEDVAKMKAQLGSKFDKNKEYVEVACPHCSEEFFLAKDDVK